MSSDLKSNSTSESVEVGCEDLVRTHMMSRTINNPRMSGRNYCSLGVSENVVGRSHVVNRRESSA